MAKQIILVTGGARSGKSKYAEQRSTELGARRLYVATAEAKDEEMAQRIAEHQKAARHRVDYHRRTAGIIRSAAGAARPDRLRASGLSDPLAEQSSAPARREICGGKSRRTAGDTAAAGFSSAFLSPTRSAGASCRTIRWRGNFATSQAGLINDIAAISQRSCSYRCGNPDDREEGNLMSLDETLKQIRPLDRSIERAAQRAARLTDQAARKPGTNWKS